MLRYRYRAYPDAKQRHALSRLFGCVRVAANDAIAARRAAYRAGQPYLKYSELSAALTRSKTTPERAYLSEVSAVPLQQAIADVDRGYRNFFAGLTGERQGPKMGPPKFRSRHDSRQSACFTRNARFAVSRTGDREAVVRLPKIGPVKLVMSRPLPSTPASVTVIREADGRTYVSFVVEVTEDAAPAAGRVCGIDPGLSSFATIVTSDTATGQEAIARIDTPKFLRSKARALARSQRALSRKEKGSKNRGKAKQRVAVLHRKVRQTRLDHAHRQAAKIIAGHDVIAVEDLNITGMARSNLARSVHDQAMGQFLRLITEKATRQGRTVVKVGRYYPSTQTCSSCRQITGPKGRGELRVRHWTCVECGVAHDRDVNAARNILTEGLRLLASASTQPTTPVDSRSLKTPAAHADGPPGLLETGEDQLTTLASVDEAGRTTGDRDDGVAA